MGAKLAMVRFAPNRLLLTASVSIIAYLLVLTLSYPLLSLYHIPLLDLGKIASYDLAHAVRFTGGYALIFAAYFIAYRAAAQWRDARGLWLIVGAAWSFVFILIWVYPVGAVDIYDYIFRARLWAIYDYNPLIVAPIQVSADAWYPYIVWVWFASPYGPLWTYLSLALYKMAGNNLLNNLLLFKLLSSLCIISSALLIHDLLKTRSTAEALGGMLLFAWNPLLLFESVVNGHNDMVMMTLVLTALWLYHHRHLYGAIVFCLLAAMIKVAALVILPMLFVACLKQLKGGRARLKFFLAGSSACVLLCITLYTPLWRGLATLDGIQALDNRFTSSLAAILKLSLESLGDAQVAEAWSRHIFGALFLVIYVYLLLKTPTEERALCKHLFVTLALFLIIGTLWFQPWYVVWVITLAPLADVHQRRLATIWSASALGLYLIFNFLWVWYAELLNASNVLVLNSVVVLAWLGPLVLTEVWHDWQMSKQQKVTA